MTPTTSKYTVQKVEVYRLFDEHGVEVVQYDDEYGHEYPLDFTYEDQAWEYVARKTGLGFHGPLTERDTLLREMYARHALDILRRDTPFLHMGSTRPLPFNSGKTIQFFS